MGITLKTHKMLWGRSGNMCAFPECKKILVVDETFTDDPSIIGEEAHIVAEKENGPRGNSPLTLEQRNKYDNLILLCSVDHKTVDDQPIEYTVEKLHQFKDEHEKWVRDNLNIDNKKIKDDELYATYIEKFIELTDLHNWTNWTSWLLGSSQLFPKEHFDLLKNLPNYIVSRIWPNRYKPLESAFINFKNVLNDLYSVFYIHIEERADGYTIEKFYKKYYSDNFRQPDDYSFKKEQQALNSYNYHGALICDLVLELTRAANYICDQIRTYIFEGFRIKEGALLVMSADILGYDTYRVEYRGDQRIEVPYKGLKDFMESRQLRDLHFGTGVDMSYFNNIRDLSVL